jgi:predicted extracellular nuclease
MVQRSFNRSPKFLVLVAAFPFLLLILTPLYFIFTVPATALSNDIVISQVYGGGGNSGATYKNDFIELFNRGSSPVDVTGWSVQYASAGGNSWDTTALSGTIQPGRYFLVQQAQGAGGTIALPTPDVTGTIAMSASSGKVALVNNNSSLTCSSSCLPNSAIIDFVGYGSTASSSESNPTPNLSNTTAALRNGNGCNETDNNAVDFSTGAPSPRNSASPVFNCGSITTTTTTTPPTTTPPTTITKIYTIQGAGLVSTYNGQVVTTEGVVTAIKTSSGRGFFLQDPTGDGDVNTSDGIFVFTSTAPGVTVGRLVRVTGTVQEYRSDPTYQPLTEIISPTITDLSAGSAITPVRISLSASGAGIRNPPTSKIFSTPVYDPAIDGLDFYESLEGMLVTVENPLVVGPTDDFSGEFAILPDNGTGATGLTSRSTITISSTDFNPERILVDDSVISGVNPALAVGDRLTAPLTGPLDYSNGNYKIQTLTPITGVDTSQRPTTETLAALNNTNHLRVASYNIENFNALPANSAHVTLVANHIRQNLGAPDLLVLVEVQDDDGTGTGTTSSTANLTALSNAISSAGGPAYAFAQIDPENNQDGGQPNGNIRQVIFYRTDRGLSFVNRGSAGANDANSVLADGVLLLSPGRIDPTNSAFSDSRKPLAAEFTFQGKRLVVIANHFNSKIGDKPLYGETQPPLLSTETKRREQATIVRGFVTQLVTADPTVRVIVAGDLNDFEFSAPLSILKNGPETQPVSPGQSLSNLVENVIGDRYTYIFEGNAQSLDHMLYSQSLSNRLVASNIVHLNSDKVPDDPARASDHEAVVGDFDFSTTCDPFIVTQEVENGSGGCGSLKYALSESLSAVKPVNIIFAQGVTTITVSTALPSIPPGVRIDGGCTVGSGGRGVPKVTVQAASGAGSVPFRMTGNSTISGLKITGFNGYAVEISGSENMLTCNWFGTADGVNAFSNGGGVHLLAGSTGTRLGLPGTFNGNLFSGNDEYGLLVEAGANARLYHNFFGYNAAGSNRLPNSSGQLKLLTGGKLYFEAGNRL